MLKKHTSLGCDTGAGGNVGKSETIPGEGEAKCVANTTSKGDGESPTRPFSVFSGKFYGFGQPLPDNVPVSGRPTPSLSAMISSSAMFPAPRLPTTSSLPSEK
jgi:hypothetical protein